MKPKTMILSAIVVGCAVGVGVNFSRRNRAKILANQKLRVGEEDRTYRLVVPQDMAEFAPLVIALHGVGDTPQSMAAYTRLDDVALRQGFLLVYPAADNRMWRTLNVASDSLETHADVRFIDELAESLHRQYRVDRSRIFVLGMSNGAVFAHVLASAKSPKIAALVAHSGTGPRGLSHPSMAPVLYVVGSEDSAMPSM